MGGYSSNPGILSGYAEGIVLRAIVSVYRGRAFRYDSTVCKARFTLGDLADSHPIKTILLIFGLLVSYLECIRAGMVFSLRVIPQVDTESTPPLISARYLNRQSSSAIYVTGAIASDGSN